MRILWIVNNIMPKLAEATGLPGSASGSWLIDISKQLSLRSDVTLAIAAIGGKEYRKLEIDNITYYVLPGTGKNMLFYTKQYEKTWKAIKEEFQPDIVHLYGTEYTHGLAFLRANPEVKSVVSVQGVISRIKDTLADGLPKRFDLKYGKLKEYIKMNGVWARRALYNRNSRYEKEILQTVDYASVVNSWDYSVARAMNGDLKFFPIEYNLREGFYDAAKWDIGKINRLQIFAAPGNDPVKGLHMLLQALPILKRKYPEVKLIIPGLNSQGNKLVTDNGYKKYLAKLIERLQIGENVVFVGRLSEKEMIEHMLCSHAVVVPSAMEGTSLVLREAMYLGVPCISSFRGGMADFIEDKKNGFLYDFYEYPYLALRLEELFADDSLAQNISLAAIEKAEKAHNRQKNIEANINMYYKIFNGEAQHGKEHK